MELGDSGIDGSLIWIHNIEFSVWISVSWFVATGAVKILIRNAPGWHGLELILEESGDVVHGEVGFKSAVERI